MNESPLQDRAQDPEISVFVLAYNEVANLAASVAELAAVLAGLGRSYELVIVDDGSTDGTGPLADEIASATPNTLAIHHPINLGLGGVYRTGFAQARGLYLTFFPADGQFPATIIPQFLARTPEADLVLGYIPQRNSSWLAKGLSTTERLLYRALFGTFPKFQGIFLLRRQILTEIPLHSQGRGWAIVMEMILRVSRGPYRVVHEVNALRPRMSGESKVNNLRNITANLRQLVALRRQF